VVTSLFSSSLAAAVVIVEAISCPNSGAVLIVIGHSSNLRFRRAYPWQYRAPSYTHQLCRYQ
jgi:hypothetical protein